MSTSRTDPPRLAVAFRVDGSATIGTGHIMRCRTLADALALRGISSVFLCRRLPAPLANLLAQSGHEIRALPAEELPAPEPTNPYGTWLGTTEKHDAQCTVEALRKANGHRLLAIIVDHYGLQAEWEQQVSARLAVPILAIDDLSRPHRATAVLDTTFGKSDSDYIGQVPADCRLMVGAQFALLRPDFMRARKAALQRRTDRHTAGLPAQDILISMGGSDPEDLTGLIIDALLPVADSFDLRLHALIGPAYPHAQRLDTQSAQAGFRLSIHRNVTDMATLLSRMDLCIGASGSSSWERCCLGLPTINLTIADNQRTIAAMLVRAGAAVDGGQVSRIGADASWTIAGLAPTAWAQRYVAPIVTDASRLSAISTRAAEIVDGFGTLRVVAGLFAWLPPGLTVALEPMQLSDAAITHTWQCFPGVRRYSRSTEVPSWDQHLAWIESKLNASSGSSLIRKITYGGIPAGVIRLDVTQAAQNCFPGNPNAREISILVAPELQGRGIAAEAIMLLLRQAPGPVVACVLKENAASQCLFQKCGFVQLDPELFLYDPLAH